MGLCGRKIRLHNIIYSMIRFFSWLFHFVRWHMWVTKTQRGSCKWLFLELGRVMRLQGMLISCPILSCNVWIILRRGNIASEIRRKTISYFHFEAALQSGVYLKCWFRISNCFRCIDFVSLNKLQVLPKAVSIMKQARMEFASPTCVLGDLWQVTWIGYIVSWPVSASVIGYY